MRTIHLDKKLSDGEAASLAGRKLKESDVDEIIREDCDVILPDGSYLLRFRKRVLSRSKCNSAYLALKDASAKSFNRGTAAGDIPEGARPDGKDVAESSGTRFRPVKRDGSVSGTIYAAPVYSGIIGFFDRYPRIPFCRQTAFNIRHGDKFSAALPFIQEVSEVFRQVHPERWAAQAEIYARTSKDFVIPGTVFTTITVNKNWQTAVHKDSGDFADGYGVMTALRAGRYKGGHTCFPQYRVGVDMENQDVLLANVHHFHGNTPMVPLGGSFVRLSCVFYYRDGMQYCGSAEEELERARKGFRSKK